MITSRSKNNLLKAGIMIYDEITRFISNTQPQTIINYNLGIDNLPNEILERMHPSSTLYVVEGNVDKCKVLYKSADPRLIIANIHSIKDRKKICKDSSIDCIVSTAPIILQTNNALLGFIDDCFSMLKKDCYMIQIIDSQEKEFLPLFYNKFQSHSSRIFFTMPLLHVYSFQKQ